MSQTRLNGKHFLALVYISICIYCLPTTTWALSDKRLCADPKCERIISMGTSILTYRSPEEGLVSFKINAPIRILSKSAGSDMDLWGVEVNGRRGYANKRFIRESKIYVPDKDLLYEVPVTLPGQQTPTETVKEPEPASVAAKQNEEQTVLNASESIVVKTDGQEEVTTTTTSPLEVNVNTDRPVINTNAAETNVAQPLQTIPVKSKVEIVDGTEIPIEELTPNEGTTEKQLKVTNDKETPEIENNEFDVDDDDDDDFDYGDDEAELDNDVVDLQNDNKIQVKPLTTSAVNIEAATKLEATKTEDQQVHDHSASQLKEDAVKVNVEVVKNATESITKSESILSEVPVEKTAENIVPITTISAQEIQTTRQSTEKQTVDSTTQGAENKDATTQATAPKIESIKQTAEPNIAATEKIVEATLPEAQQIIETAKQVVLQNAESATPTITQNVVTQEATIAQAAAQSITPNAEEATQNAQATIQAATQNVEAAAQSAQAATQSVEAATQSVEAATHSAQAATHSVESATQNAESTTQSAEATTQATENSETIIELAPTDTKQNTESVDKIQEKGNDTETQSTETNTTKGFLDKAQEEALHIQPKANTEDETEKIVANSSTNQPETHTEQTQETTIPIPNIASNTNELKDAEVQLNTNPTTLVEEIQKPQAELNVPLTSAQVPESVIAASNDEAITNEVKHEAPSPIDEQLKTVEQIQVEQTTAAPALATGSSLPPLFQPKQFDSNTADEILNKQHDIVNERNENELPAVQVEAETPQALNYDVYDYVTPTYDSHHTPNVEELDKPTPAPALAQNIAEELNTNQEAAENVGVGTVESVDAIKHQTQEPIVMPSTITPSLSGESLKDDDGLFATILGTVNSFLSNNKKERSIRDDYDAEQDLERILYPERTISKQTQEDSSTCIRQQANEQQSPISLDNFIEVLAAKVLDNSQLLLCLTVAAASSLFFVFGYYCFCNSSNEGALLAKLNQLERSLLAAHKENSILKHDLMTTRTKLSSIEDNSFGSNDMVISLKKQLEVELLEKAKLQEQVKSLEKDLVSAADAGLELNKYVSELLANQNGDETIKDTIEELQRQLNEQDQTIREINASLAEKSRENSELQLSLAEQNARLTSDLSILQQDNDELEAEKANLQTRIEQMTTEFEQNLNKALEGKNYEIQRLQNHILDINAKWEREHNELQTNFAKIEALEDCLKSLKKDSNTNMDELIDAAKLRGELSAMQKKYANLKAQRNSELESKALTENQMKSLSEEIEKLKKEFNQSEKEKLDAQTRLEVLSNYFKEKEAQLQKELNVQEAMWLKQQGENTGTVDKITGMQEEIQTLKSQNEELRAEIEAQVASHKAQTGILQNRVHEHYLTARQAERRCDEARNEAAILRSRLTAMANGNVGDQASNASGNELPNKLDNKDAPSPLPGSPFFPPPLPFLPPQAFLGTPAAHFMGLPPPPPFLPPPPEDLRPAPLGRMRSPTTRSARYSPSDSRRSGRYSPRDDYSDYDDDDYYDDDYDDRIPSHRRRRSWQREQYSPPPRTYRSLSPTESRYNGADTETDFSPPASPRSDRAPARPINEV